MIDQWSCKWLFCIVLPQLSRQNPLYTRHGGEYTYSKSQSSTYTLTQLPELHQKWHSPQVTANTASVCQEDSPWARQLMTRFARPRTSWASQTQMPWSGQQITAVHKTICLKKFKLQRNIYGCLLIRCCVQIRLVAYRHPDKGGGGVERTVSLLLTATSNPISLQFGEKLLGTKVHCTMGMHYDCITFSFPDPPHIAIF